VPKNCETPTICPDAGVIQKDIFVSHPAHQYSLEGQDVADLTGEISYLCGDMLGHAGMSLSYTMLSHFVLEFWSAWGQYAICNDRQFGNQSTSFCLGGDAFGRVGHAAAWEFHPQEGQCQDNHDVGEWYSLPSQGKCSAGMMLGEPNCSWRTKQHVKTITTKCLIQEKNFLRACSASAGIPPFKMASRTLMQAFRECPAVVLSESGRFFLPEFVV